LADPPWSYYGDQGKWGAAAKFYETMTDQELLDFTLVSEVLRPRGILFCWATSPRLDFALQCIRNWGLTYRGVAFVWVKTKKDGTPIGAQGVRPSITKPLCEFVLAASRVAKGRPLPLHDEGIVQTVLAPKGEHSEKPNQVQDAIDRMYPNADKLEMFARRRRRGWLAWGNELHGAG